MVLSRGSSSAPGAAMASVTTARPTAAEVSERINLITCFAQDQRRTCGRTIGAARAGPTFGTLLRASQSPVPFGAPSRAPQALHRDGSGIAATLASARAPPQPVGAGPSRA